VQFPRGSASSIISLSAGAIAASAVAIAWLPLLTESGQREIQNEVRHLRSFSRLAATQLSPAQDLPEAEPDLERFRQDAALDAVWVLDEGGAVELQVPSGPAPSRSSIQAVMQLCSSGPVGGVSETVSQSIEFISGSRALRAACAPVPQGASARYAVVLDSAETAGPLSSARTRASSLLFGLGAVVALIVIGGIRWLLSPVGRISEAARRIADGERGIRLQPQGPAEIAQLARAVNLLASSVETREDEITGRLDVVSQLTSLVAHEVRNPLQSLSLLTTLARTEPDEAARNQLLETMEQEINGLEGVVQRFLRTSGPLRLTPRSCDVVELVTRAASIAEPKARNADVRLMIQAPGRLEAVVDGSMLRRAIENLMLNAIEFASLEPPGQVTTTIKREGEKLRLVVDDDGPGVPDEELNRIFQPYYTSKAGGTGLGLALCKRVFKAHGGNLRYEPSPLGGARFVGTLPLQPPPASHDEG
jgi:signal transduction histidine kinase